MQIMGKAIKIEHARRCDFCKKPVKFGYIVDEGTTHGFFCGSQCYGRAVEHVKELEKKKV